MAKRNETGTLFPKKTNVLPEGYYSGDKPNPNLRKFVEKNATPYDPDKDDYNVRAFNRPLDTSHATAVYNMHVYHLGKKAHGPIRLYISHFTKPGDIVLDPFCGSGGTALTALMESRKAVAIDRSPAATFITKNHCTPINTDQLRLAFDKVKREIQDEIAWLYTTRCDRCGGKATTGYTVYSQVFQCPRCLSKIPLYDCGESDSETKTGKAKTVMVCPTCQAHGFTEVIRSQSQKFGYVPVKVVYHCEGECEPSRDVRGHDDSCANKRSYFEQYDLAKIREIDSSRIPYWYPKDCDMTWMSRYQRDALFYYGVKNVDDLYTKRNLWALAVLRHAISKVEDTAIRDALMFGFTGITLSSSRMYRERKRSVSNGTYTIAQVSREMVVVNGFDYKVETQLIPAFDELCEIQPGDVCISTQSATNWSAIPSNSIDYIFTDPPYAAKVQYGELNYVWEAWLNLDTRWHEDEIVINEARGKTALDWATMMKQALTECYRVLKPGRWLSLCYHKPKQGEWAVTRMVIPADADIPTFRELARKIIREFLQENSGVTKDRIYDDLVSRMVRAGQMQAHNFLEILREVAEEVQEPRRTSSRTRTRTCSARTLLAAGT